MSNSSLVNKTILTSVNYDKGRSGRTIKKITIHHCAGVMSIESIGNLFRNGSREVSSHYGIGNDGRIGQYVDESNTAWTDGNWESNCTSVTIETSNSKTGGNWEVSDSALNSLIKLVADIGKRNNLGTLVKGKNVTWHSMYSATACPGNYLLSKMDYIVSQANKINSTSSNPTPTKTDLKIENITNKKVKLKIDANLWNLDFNTYAEAKAVKQYKKGDIIEVSALAYHPIGSKYYLTEYSYSRNIHNGFNVVDCEDYIETIIYTVQSGDTLSGIASKYGTTWQKIYNDNKSVIGSNPNLIKPGQVLTIK